MHSPVDVREELGQLELFKGLLHLAPHAAEDSEKDNLGMLSIS
jgi:hypothetical protein